MSGLLQSTNMCEHLLDTTILEILKTNDYRAKGFLKVIYCGKIIPSESYSLNIQKGTNSLTDHPLPSDKKPTSKRKKVKGRRVIHTTRCPDENNHRWGANCLNNWHLSLGEIFGLFLYFQKNTSMSNEGTGVETIRMN